ncbi:MAG: cellulase family glycosylhydrolase [Ruminococcus sp.]|nr:cellulase family glycosylhydrolase [Ruminococcus sp.]
MKRKTAFMLSALLMASSVTGCGSKGSTPSPDSSSAPAGNTHDAQEVVSDNGNTDESSEEASEPPTKHISPVETVSAPQGTQIKVDQVVSRDPGNNTIKIPLAHFIEEGDRVESFTFIIYSDGGDIGTFKGGCGISVANDCPSATDAYWYQSEDFTAPTQGSYGEIKWNVPAELVDYISDGGEVLFGYWWGNVGSVRLDTVVCNYTRTRDLPVDGTVTQPVGQVLSYGGENKSVSIPMAGLLPENAVPQAVTCNVSSAGALGKFTCGFGYTSGAGTYNAPDTAVFTDAPNLEYTWFVPENAKVLAAPDGAVTFGYWWSQQPDVTVESITVKYSCEDGAPPPVQQTPAAPTEPVSGGEDFRSSQEIVDDMIVGWNLGNTLDSYDTGKTGLDTETGWGNLKATPEMIQAIKTAGFNAVRIPVTWSEHMDGANIDSAWMDRVQEVVDYAYDRDLYVIVNMHHDDYIWFTPSEEKYDECSERLMGIWAQIADRFRDYGDRLLFEGMNEPRTIGSANEWMGGTSAERSVVNRYARDFVNTVRASGGNNAQRTLIVTTYGASAEEVATKDVIIPNDPHIVLSLHYYAPWKFCNGQSTSFGSSEKAELSARFASIKNRFSGTGVPVLITEFGCVAGASDETRAEYYKHYVSTAKANGMKCFVWDNGTLTGKDSFGIFNRGTLEWNTTILKGIMEGAES